MSQIFKPQAATPPPPGFVEFLQGNDGINVGPNGADVIFVPGNGALASGTSTAPNLVTTNTAANTLKVSPTQAQFMTNYTNVAASPYNVVATDYYLSVNCSGGAITINLNNVAPGTNRLLIVKDRTGNAAVNNITLSSTGNIDLAATFVMNSNYQAVQLLFNGTNWEVF